MLLAAFVAQAQQTSGSITGIVKDTQGAVVPGAHVTLTDQERAAQRKQDASAIGMFTFDLVMPSTYTVSVEVAGFKKWEKKDVKLYATDRVAVNDIVLEVGQVTDTVTVEATTAQLQTESASVAGVVTSQQVSELSVRDRNFMYLMRTIPGVTNIDGYHINANGGRSDQNSFRLDGLSNMDYGDNGCCATWANMDMIAEVKVVTNTGTADMGSLSGAQVNVVTKSGNKEFHGNLYFYKRAEWMNANSWTNNRTGTARGRDRNNQGGYTLGGPLYIPKVFNTNKEKLYFFATGELWKNLSPGTTTLTVPTALERTGDFSKSARNDNSLPLVLDPLNARTQFPGNIVPTSRINKDAQKLMNLIPLPNITGQVTYNYQLPRTSSYSDKLVQSYRIDYNINDKWRTYFRYTKDYSEGGSPAAMANFEFDSAGRTMGWQVSPKPDFSLLLNTTTIISPTFTNEFIVGGQSVMYHYYIDKLGIYTRSQLGLSFTLPYPNAVIGDYGPRIGFGGSGLSSSPSLGTGLPYIALAHDYNLVDNLTKVFSRHTVKAGLTFELNRKDQDTWSGTNHAGNFNFNRDSLNPGDTDYQFSNFLTGAFQTFNQLPKVLEGRYIWKQPEWYIADTWKAKENITIDWGLRFYYMMPGFDAKNQMATFDPTLWDATKTVKLFTKALVNGKSATINPLTGAVVPNYMLGAIVPGYGDPDNGLVKAFEKGRSQSLMPTAGLLFAPRFGMAWQPRFLPKTVIRVGGGVFYDRLQGNVTYDSKTLPPITRTITLQYGMMSDISSAQGTLMTPPGLGGGYLGSGKIPTTINYNFTIERELPSATVLSIGYVGNIARHMIYRQSYNEPYYGAAWLPQNQDPTAKTPMYDGTTTLAANFYRPYTGLGQVDIYSVGATSNYNSLQLQINKRMSRKLSYGVAYTFSKAMGIGDSIWDVPNAWDAHYNYGRRGFDRTHIMTANFVYYLPKFGKNGNFVDHPGLRLILNDWQLSGIVTAQSGTPTNFGYSFSSGVSNQARQYTGTERYGPRPVIAANWVIPKDQQNEFVQFNTAAIAPASRPSVGRESGFYYWSNPPTFWSSPEITFFKNIRYTKDERRYVQLRAETYNLLNHHDYTGRSTSATFRSPTDLTLTNLPDAIVGTAVTNGGRFGYGALSGAASPRRMQVAVKIYF